MSKPVLLSGGNGKVSELAGTEVRQVLTWTSADEWAPGPGVGGSGGGGELFYLNALTNPDPPVVNIPTGASGTTVKELGTSADGTGSTVSSTSSVPVSPTDPEIIAGFVTDLSVPNATEIPAGLWEFNVWAAANGNTTNQSFIQAKVYKYDGVNAPGTAGSDLIATSAEVYLYDPGDVTQYTLSVLIPGGKTLLETDRIYVEILGGSTTSNRQITLSFGNSTPSHVHTTLFIPIDLGTDVTGTLPVANGGTGATTLSVTQGTVYYGDGSKLVGLAPGTSGQFLQTQGADANPQWASAGSATTPYDISGEFAGTPASGATIMRFVAARTFTFGGTAYFAATSNTGATTAVFTVNVNGASRGTVSIAGNATSGTDTIASTLIAAGNLITVVATTSANVVNPYWTLPGTV